MLLTGKLNIVVNAPAVLQTSESGASVAVQVSLPSIPSADVVMGTVSVSDTKEGMAAPSQLTFTQANWDVPQTIYITGVDDLVSDGDRSYLISLGSLTGQDSRYDGVFNRTLSFINKDNETTAGVTVFPASGLVTTEAGAATSFAVSLQTAPLANVTINVSSSNPAEGTVAPASLTFTSANWFLLQTVTVTGVDDALADGTHSVVLSSAISGDPAYNGIDPPDISAANSDNETPGFTVSAVSGNISETGSSATFYVIMNTPPGVTNTVSVSSSDNTEATVAPAVLSFDNTNYSNTVVHTVTVTGLDDSLFDGTKNISILLGPAVGGGVYNGLDPSDPSFSVRDNDKRIFVTVPLVKGDMGGSGLAGADLLCLSEASSNSLSGNYRALLGTVTSRIATTGVCGATCPGQLGWVLQGQTTYRRLNTTPIFTTSSAGIFPFGVLTNPVTASSMNIWTGLNTDWTTASGFNCADWTNNSNGGGPGTQIIGDTSQSNSQLLNQVFPLGKCGQLRPILCVEQ